MAVVWSLDNVKIFDLTCALCSVQIRFILHLFLPLHLTQTQYLSLRCWKSVMHCQELINPLSWWRLPLTSLPRTNKTLLMLSLRSVSIHGCWFLDLIPFLQCMTDLQDFVFKCIFPMYVSSNVFLISFHIATTFNQPAFIYIYFQSSSKLCFTPASRPQMLLNSSRIDYASPLFFRTTNTQNVMSLMV